MGMSHEIAQGEGGEQGDPLMPMLFALGLHPALRAAQARMRVGERIFAYLDDVYVICRPEQVVEIFKILEEMLAHSQIRLHLGKSARHQFPDRSARVVKPDAIVWRGDVSLPLEQQPEYVRHFLSVKSVEHETLFAAWLFLLMCTSPRATFWLRSVNPDLTDVFAEHHNAHVWQCLQRIIGS